ncbi:hypothetical protein B0H14DRAFT_2601638 [Mycena olivaceomarginata]|nr:hypothetical protein B0H14DRAFT_2601638 [Mycena olivaceomarginata]
MMEGACLLETKREARDEAEHEHPRAESVGEYSAHNIGKRTVKRNRWQRRSRVSELRGALSSTEERAKKEVEEKTTISDGQEEKTGTDVRFGVQLLRNAADELFSRFGANTTGIRVNERRCWRRDWSNGRTAESSYGTRREGFKR